MVLHIAAGAVVGEMSAVMGHTGRDGAVLMDVDLGCGASDMYGGGSCQ